MCILKVIGMILLALYLILSGGITIFAATPTPEVKHLIDLLAISSGILILISINRCVPHKE